MTYKKTSELKTSARGRMLGNYKVAIYAFVLMELIIFLIGEVTNSVVDISTLSGEVIYYAIVFIVNLIAAVFMAGELSIYLKIACGKKASVSDLFSAFKEYPDKVIVIQLLIMLRMILVCIPMFVSGAWLLFSEGDLQLPAIVFAVCALIGVVGCAYVKIATSQSMYMLLDFPQYSAKELVESSIRIMKGHMWKYLAVSISFIPLMLLGVLSGGIGMLFIYPYYQMTLTEFYLDIIREPEQEISTFSVTV